MAADRSKSSGYESRVNNPLVLWKRLLNSSHGERSVSCFQVQWLSYCGTQHQVSTQFKHVNDVVTLLLLLLAKRILEIRHSYTPAPDRR